MSVYVGNLSYDVTDNDLTAVFAEYGSVKRVQLPTDRETGRMRGFAFVEMSADAEETAAIAPTFPVWVRAPARLAHSAEPIGSGPIRQSARCRRCTGHAHPNCTSESSRRRRSLSQGFRTRYAL